MQFRTTGLLLLGAMALPASGTAQTTAAPPAIARTVIAATKLPTVTDARATFVTHRFTQVARALGISAKTADRHIQNAYRKIGVSTRAAATLFAMEHGLVAWGELPMARPATRS